MPPEYVDECSKPQGTVDRTRNRVMIELDGRVGQVPTGPPRASLAEAEEDLHALRALPRANVSESREDVFASLASKKIPVKRRRLDISE